MAFCSGVRQPENRSGVSLVFGVFGVLASLKLVLLVLASPKLTAFVFRLP